jgi:multicomponent Na+:H+ antiporter subunit D
VTIALALFVPWVAAVVAAGFDGRRPAVARAAVVALAAHAVVVVVLAAQVLGSGPQEVLAGDWPAGLGIRLRADALGITFALTSVIALLAATAFATSEGLALPASPALVLALATGLTGLFLTADVFSFYVFFELSMASAYVLASAGEKPRHLGGAYLFAIVNLVGTFVFLLGIAGLYHLTGTLDMDQVAARVAQAEEGGVLLAGAALFTAFGVKLGLFPFHFWLPRVYAGVRAPVAAILSGALANIGAYGLLRFGGHVLPGALEEGAPMLLALGAASILYGSVQAIARRSAIDVLAYSSIAQVGYVLVALAVGGAVGFAAAVVYAVVNSLNKTLLFLAAGVRGWLVGAAFAIGALSVAGVPPAAGFVGKLSLVRTGVDESSAALVALVLVGSGLSFLYIFRIQQADFWRRPPDRPSAAAPARAVLVAMSMIVVVLGLWPQPLLELGDRAAAVLEAPR